MKAKFVVRDIRTHNWERREKIESLGAGIIDGSHPHLVCPDPIAQKYIEEDLKNGERHPELTIGWVLEEDGKWYLAYRYILVDCQHNYDRDHAYEVCARLNKS